MWVWVKYGKKMLIVGIHFVVFERITQAPEPQARSSIHVNAVIVGFSMEIFPELLSMTRNIWHLATSADPEVDLEDCQSLDESSLRTPNSWHGHGRVYVGWAPSRVSLCSQGSFPACRAARAACSGRAFVATPGDILVSWEAASLDKSKGNVVVIWFTTYSHVKTPHNIAIYRIPC